MQSLERSGFDRLQGGVGLGDAELDNWQHASYAEPGIGVALTLPQSDY